MQTFSYTVTKADGGKTASEYLRRCHGYSRRMITRLKQGCGSLAVNGERTVHLGTLLKEGDELTVAVPVREQRLEPNAALDAPVVYEDADLAVFSKPAGMPSHPSHLHRSDTLLNAFAARYAGEEGVGFHLLNRLDRDTSGLCVVAKHPLAAARLAGKVEKVYYAAAEGTVEPPSGVISLPIARAPGSIILRRVDPDGKPAVTRYETLRNGNGHTLLRIRLETGRTHQIRVHLSHAGHPLAGDDLYGGSLERIGRQALHCGEVRFPHPTTGETMTFTAPLPEEIRAVFRDDAV